MGVRDDVKEMYHAAVRCLAAGEDSWDATELFVMEDDDGS